MRKENITYEDTSRSSDSIKKIANATGAQIVILGKAGASFFTSIKGTAMKSYRSDVAITAVNISDYSTIARATHQAGGVGGSDKDAHSIALVKSADYISDDFVNQIVQKWQSEVQNGTEYTIYVNNKLKEINETHDSIPFMIFSQSFGIKSFNINIDERKECMEAIFNNKEFDTINSNESVKNLYKGYQYISDIFPDDITEKNLLHFCDWLIEKLFFIEIVASTEQDAHKIFISMNDRGLM